MTAPAELTRQERTWMFLPAIIALLALGHGQHRIAFPAILLLVLIAALTFGWRFTGEVVIAALIMGGGAILGLLQPAEQSHAAAAFPQPMFHALSLGTAALLVFLCLANEKTAAWITSFVVVGLALDGKQNLVDIILLSALIGAVLYVPSALSGNRVGSRIFLVAVLLSTGVFLFGFAAINRTLLHIVGDWARNLDNSSGVGLATDPRAGRRRRCKASDDRDGAVQRPDVVGHRSDGTLASVSTAAATAASPIVGAAFAIVHASH
jgi:hypothetical protein